MATSVLAAVIPGAHVDANACGVAARPAAPDAPPRPANQSST